REDAGIVGIIAANTRTPDKVLGDLRAQRSALRVGELRLQELAARYGRDVLFRAMDEIIERTEASMRAAIRAVPDGVYTFEDFMDDYGPGTEPLRVAVTVTVAGDTMVIDYEGSSPQTASGMNSYINYTRSYAYAAVKCLTDPFGPMNEGALRPITVTAPEATQPIIVERFELIRDSAGPGKFRGGSGIRRDLRFLADDGKLTNLADRQTVAPYGLFGGRPGTLGRTVINPGPNEEVVHGKASRGFAYGDVVSFQQPGAGGYGDPLERDPRRLLDD